jgi:hypothetical protein
MEGCSFFGFFLCNGIRLALLLDSADRTVSQYERLVKEMLGPKNYAGKIKKE